MIDLTSSHIVKNVNIFNTDEINETLHEGHADVIIKNKLN